MAFECAAELATNADLIAALGGCVAPFAEDPATLVGENCENPEGLVSLAADCLVEFCSDAATFCPVAAANFLEPFVANTPCEGVEFGDVAETCADALPEPEPQIFECAAEIATNPDVTIALGGCVAPFAEDPAALVGENCENPEGLVSLAADCLVEFCSDAETFCPVAAANFLEPFVANTPCEGVEFGDVAEACADALPEPEPEIFECAAEIATNTDLTDALVTCVSPFIVDPAALVGENCENPEGLVGLAADCLVEFCSDAETFCPVAAANFLVPFVANTPCEGVEFGDVAQTCADAISGETPEVTEAPTGAANMRKVSALALVSVVAACMMK